MPAKKMSQTEEVQTPTYDHRLTPRQESYLKASKEIAIKYIETGRISVAAFDETFRRIYQTVKETMESDV